AGVVVLTPPSAPSLLTPTVADATEPITLTWRHNTVDTTGQSKYEIRWRLNSASAWNYIGPTTSSTSQYVLAANTWANGSSREGQVRTWGEHPDPGPWSYTRSTSLSGAPVVSITTPGATVNGTNVQVQWTYFDPEGTSRIAWQA